MTMPEEYGSEFGGIDLLLHYTNTYISISTPPSKFISIYLAVLVAASLRWQLVGRFMVDSTIFDGEVGVSLKGRQLRIFA